MGTSPDDRPRWRRRRLYLQGLHAAVSGNAQAFGFSIVITVSYGIVYSYVGQPTRLELVGYAMAAVAAFSLLNLLVAVMTRGSETDTEPTRVVLVATATDFLAVGGGIAAAFATGAVIASGWVVWVLAPALAGLAYALIQALELAVGLARASRD